MDNESEQVTRPAPSSAERDGEAGVPARGRYDFEIDPDSDSTHARIVRLAGSDRRVLELGTASGYMSRLLHEHGCSVVGIELDPAMAAEAERYCERMIVGDLETLDLVAELGSELFDVIVAADVLEHLKDPLAVLQRLRRSLTPQGFFVISLPNVAHGSVRLALLQGHFSYQKVGLLDQTHLRFFTRESIDELLDGAELAAAEIYHQQLRIDASEVPYDRSTVPDELIRLLERDADALTYQFVIKAIPLAAPGLREVQRRMRELAHTNARLVEENVKFREAEPELRKLQEALAAIGSREGQLRSALIDAHDQLLRRDEEIRRLREVPPASEVLRNRLRRTRPGRAYIKGRRLVRRLSSLASSQQ